MKKWTEYDYGYDYAKHTQKDGETQPVNIELRVRSTNSIPEFDYMIMKTNGIINPDARLYWQGYNARMSE